MYLIKALLDPLAMLWLFISFGLVYKWVIKRHADWFLWVFWVLLSTLSSPVVVNQVTMYFEMPKNYSQCNDAIDRPIVVLGGGLDNRVNRLSEFQYLSKATLSRVFSGIELARRYPSSKIILSGGGRAELSEAQMMGALFLVLGVDPHRLNREPRSMDTYENAVFTKKLLYTEGLDRSVTLVTSALHMDRAANVFLKQGINVCPYATDHMGSHLMPKYALIPNTQALGKTASLVHELVGWWYYKSRGWI